MLSEAMHLSAHRVRPFAEFTLERSEGLRVTIYSRSCLLKFIITRLRLLSFHYLKPLRPPWFLPGTTQYICLLVIMCMKRTDHITSGAI